MTKKTWLEIIQEAMGNLGGHAHYSDLYKEIESLYPEKTSSVKDFKAQVRGTIERYSSDSKVFHSNNQSSDNDIFYSVHDIGSGHWGLNNFSPNSTNVDLTEDDAGFPEGKLKLKEHLYRDRNYKVISEAKKEFEKKHGKLFCEVCGFDFNKVYGEIGEGYIEGHHTIPVSDLKDGDKTYVKDIALVCSNCHKMIHRKRPWLSINDLKSILK